MVVERDEVFMETDIRAQGCIPRTLACVGLSVVIGLAYVVMASMSVNAAENAASIGWSWLDLALFYFGVAITGGVVVGVLLPISHRRLGAWVLGFIVAGLYIAPITISLGGGLKLFLSGWLLGGPAIGLMAVVFLWRPVEKTT